MRASHSLFNDGELDDYYNATLAPIGELTNPGFDCDPMFGIDQMLRKADERRRSLRKFVAEMRQNHSLDEVVGGQRQRTMGFDTDGACFVGGGGGGGSGGSGSLDATGGSGGFDAAGSHFVGGGGGGGGRGGGVHENGSAGRIEPRLCVDGMNGREVIEILQRIVGARPDGILGPETHLKAKRFELSQKPLTPYSFSRVMAPCTSVTWSFLIDAVCEPPYYLDVNTESDGLFIETIQLGKTSLIHNRDGMTKPEAFCWDQASLVPMDGPHILPGTVAIVTFRLQDTTSRQVSATFWARHAKKIETPRSLPLGFSLPKAIATASASVIPRDVPLATVSDHSHRVVVGRALGFVGLLDPQLEVSLSRAWPQDEALARERVRTAVPVKPSRKGYQRERLLNTVHLSDEEKHTLARSNGCGADVSDLLASERRMLELKVARDDSDAVAWESPSDEYP